MSEMRYGLVIETKGAKEATDEMSRISQAQEKASDTAKKYGEASKQAGREFSESNKQIIDSITKQGAALNQANSAQQEQEKRVNLVNRAWSGFNQTLATAKNKFNEIVGSLSSVNKQFEKTELSAGQMKNAMRSVPAQFTDIATQLQGGANPLTVLMQQGGQLKDMFGSVGGAAKGLASYILSLITPFTVLVGVVAALGVAYYQASSESENIRNSIIMSGNAAGVTAEQVHSMAKNMDVSFGVTRGAAAEVLTQLISTGNVAKDNMQGIAESILNTSKFAGIATEQLVQNFNELGKNPVEASRKLNEQYNYLTGSIYEQIKALKEQGKDEEAAALAQKTFSDALNSRAEEIKANLGSIQKWWMSVKDAAKEAWDAMLDIGREESFSEKLASAQQQLARMKSNKLVEGEGFFASTINFGARLSSAFTDNQKKIDAINAQQKEVKRLENKIYEDAMEGTRKIEKAKQDKKDVENSDVRDAYLKQRKGLTKLTALEDENKAYRKAIEAAAGHNQKLQEIEAAHAAAITKINEQFKGKSEKIPKEITAYESLKRVIAEKLEQSKAEVESAKEVTESQRLRIRAEQDLESGRIKANASQRASIFSAIDEIEKNEKLRKEKEKKLRLDREQIEAAKQLKSHTDDYVASIQSNIEQGRIELALLGKTDEERKVELALLKAKDDYQKQIKQVNQSKASDSVKQEEIEKITEAYRNLVVEIPVRFKAEDLQKTKKELDDFFDPTKAQDFGSALEGALNKTASAMQKLTSSFGEYARSQEKINVLKEKAAKFKDTDSLEYAKQMGRINDLQAREQIKNYASMAGAAKGFFAEGTKGYKTLEAAENAFRAYQLASDLIKGLSAAKLAIVTQAQGDPYTAWVRMAAMAAAVAALGYNVGSVGKGGETAAERQKVQGTGTVFGDAAAKSASISKSIEEMAKTSNQLLPINQGMLNALRNIESGIAGVTNLVVRTNGGVADGKAFNIKEGVIGTSKNALFDPLGIWGKTKQNIVDSGIQFGGNLTDLIAGKGFDQYASVDTVKSSWLGMKKSITNTQQKQALDSELSHQMGLIFGGMRSSLIEANKALGKTTQDIEGTFNSMVLSAEKISLKGLKGEELNQAINAVISKSLDEMAKQAFPAYDKFRDIGEGYAQTVLRVANTYASVNQTLEQLKLKIFEVGDAGVDSAMKLVKLVGGMENFQSLSQSYYQNFFTEEERFQKKRADLTKALSQVGIALPSSKEAYRAEVEKQRNANNEEAVATLLKLNEAFKDVIDSAQSGASSAEQKASADRKAEIASRKAAEAITAQAKATEELAKKNLQKDYDEKLSQRLRSGKTEELLNAKMLLNPIPTAQYMTQAGEFVAGAFNQAMAIHRAKESAELITQASDDALNIENVRKVIGDLRSNLFSDDFVHYLKSEVMTSFKIETQSYTSRTLDSLIGFMADKSRNEGYASYGGIAGLHSAQANLSLATDARVDDAYKEAMVGIKWSFDNGKISLDEYNKSLKKADELYKELKSSPAQIAELRDDVQRAALASVGYYFGQISQQVEKMGEAAKAASEPIALATSAINRFKSISYVFDESSKAITLGKNELFNPSKDKSALVAALANIASKALTTADAARVAKDLESKASFKSASKESLRDFSMLLDGVKQYDASAFEKSFLRITDALGKGVINYQQYSDLFEESLNIYRGENEAAKQFIDSMNSLSKAMREFKNDLLIDKTKTTLDEGLRMSVLSARLSEAASAAQSGNSEDISRFQDLSNKLLDKSNYETQAQYNEAFGRVMNEADRLEKYASKNNPQDINLRMEKELQGIRKEFKDELREVQKLLAQGLGDINNNTKATREELEIARASR